MWGEPLPLNKPTGENQHHPVGVASLTRRAQYTRPGCMRVEFAEKISSDSDGCGV